VLNLSQWCNWKRAGKLLGGRVECFLDSHQLERCWTVNEKREDA